MIRLLLLALLLLNAACARVVMPAGPAVQAPALVEEAVIAADGARLRLRRFAPEAPPRAVLLALHGFNDHSGNFLVGSIDGLKEAGILVYAYDQRGFGLSPHRGYWPGAETLANDAAAAARLVAARHPDLPLFLLGESMGAAVAILAATGDTPPPARGIILLAPALWNRALMNPFMRGGLWIGEHVFPGWPVQGSAPGVVASDNEAALRRLRTDPLVIRTTRVDSGIGLIELMDQAVAALPRCCGAPALLLYGAEDTVVPPRMTRAAVASLPPGTPLRFGVYGAGHHLLLAGGNREEVLRDILAFIADQAAPLPSGAEAAAPAWINR